jgi:superfamily II DNA/RNA helicase
MVTPDESQVPDEMKINVGIHTGDRVVHNFIDQACQAYQTNYAAILARALQAHTDYQQDKISDMDMMTATEALRKITVIDPTLGITQQPKFMSTFMAVVDRLSENRNSCTVVFSEYTEFLDLFSQFCTSNKVRTSKLYGTLTAVDMDNIRKELSPSGKSRILLTEFKAAGVGFNLQFCDMVILTAPTMDLAMEEQAVARVCRTGQTKKVRIVRLVTLGTHEEWIMENQPKSFKERTRSTVAGSESLRYYYKSLLNRAPPPRSPPRRRSPTRPLPPTRHHSSSRAPSRYRSPTRHRSPPRKVDDRTRHHSPVRQHSPPRKQRPTREYKTFPASLESIDPITSPRVERYQPYQPIPFVHPDRLSKIMSIPLITLSVKDRLSKMHQNKQFPPSMQNLYETQ